MFLALFFSYIFKKNVLWKSNPCYDLMCPRTFIDWFISFGGILQTQWHLISHPTQNIQNKYWCVLFKSHSVYRLWLTCYKLFTVLLLLETYWVIPAISSYKSQQRSWQITLVVGPSIRVFLKFILLMGTRNTCTGTFIICDWLKKPF